jgi:hypothetical protein
VKIKGYLVVACATAFVSWLIFSPDGEKPENGSLSPESATGTGRPLLPKEPQPAPARVQKGIAQGPRQPWQDRRPWVSAPPPRPGYAGRPDQPERYSFRPLSERERERLESDRPAAGGYGAPPLYPTGPYAQDPWASRAAPDRGGWSDYGGSATARPWYGEGFGRPADPRPGGGYAEPPYDAFPGQPGREDRAREPASPWGDPTAPQWGSHPPEWQLPEERMYPSLGTPLDRKLSAR